MKLKEFIDFWAPGKPGLGRATPKWYFETRKPDKETTAPPEKKNVHDDNKQTLLYLGTILLMAGNYPMNMTTALTTAQEAYNQIFSQE